MRFSALFAQSEFPLQVMQGDDAARPEGDASADRERSTIDRKEEEAEDLDQRVRRIGEWQIEDW